MDSRREVCIQVADYIVTGDKKDLLPIRKYNKIEIVSVDEFLNMMMKQ